MTWLESGSILSVALTSQTHRELSSHLLRSDGQEDLCFILWKPSTGLRRRTAVLGPAILPLKDERNVHGNVSFEGDYFLRAAGEASREGCGVALAHSHPGGTYWQGMSSDDYAAESGHAGQALAITGLPMLGLTLAGADLRWSARFWMHGGSRSWIPREVETVRVVGEQLRVSFNPAERPPPRENSALVRTVSAWGSDLQSDLGRLRVGIVGAGSVGAIVGEGIARMGVEQIKILEFDAIEDHNRDRLLHARFDSVGRAKAYVLAEALRLSATALNPTIEAVTLSVCEPDGLAHALDCDVLFSCVDRPWPRAVLNMAAFAHLVPVVDGGVMVDPGRRAMRGAEWRAHVSAPGRKCMECIGQYDPGMVQVERDGLLDSSSYLSALPLDHPIKRRENVFAFSSAAASALLLQMLSMVIAPAGVADIRSQLFHFATGRVDIDETDCTASCLYQHAFLGIGDSAPVVTGPHRIAETARESYRPMEASIVNQPAGSVIAWLRRVLRRW